MTQIPNSFRSTGVARSYLATMKREFPESGDEKRLVPGAML